MKITIEITVEEARMLLQHEEKPEITDELHEDFEDDPKETVTVHDIPSEVSAKPDGRYECQASGLTTVGTSEPSPDPEPEPEPVPDPGWTAKTEQKNVRKSRAVWVKVDGEWHRFSSMTNAAKLIGCFPSQVSSALANGWKVRGYELRYAKEEQDEEDLPRGNGHE